MKDDVSLNFKVGLFVLLTFLIFGVFLFTIGSQEHLLQKTYIVETSFYNTAGLIRGAPVRLSGVKVGTVNDIRFPSSFDETEIMVLMEINEEGVKRLSLDSLASIKTEGLLGDKYIEIIRGVQSPPATIPQPFILMSVSYPEFDRLLGQSEELLQNVIGISDGLKEIVGAFTKEDNVENISKTISSLRNTMEELETGDGLLHTMIYGRGPESKPTDEKNAIEQFEDTISKLYNLLDAVEHGDGLLHGLIYDEQLKRDVRTSIESLDSALLKFGGDGGIAAELQLTIQNLRRVSEKLESGEGTMGALLNDPELYDNIKGLVGQAERSKFIRATVQYLMENQKQEKPSK